MSNSGGKQTVPPTLGAVDGDAAPPLPPAPAVHRQLSPSIHSIRKPALSMHDCEDTILGPWRYIMANPGKNVRSRLIDAFQAWLSVPAPAIRVIKEIVGYLHNASLLIDDIEDNSRLRRGRPVAHKIYGLPNTLNCANYIYFMALERCHTAAATAGLDAAAARVAQQKALDVFVREMLNLHRGQGLDILWREQAQCPTEAEYKAMVLDKTGGLFRVAVGLMQALSPAAAAAAAAAGGGGADTPADGGAAGAGGAKGPDGAAAAARDYTPLVNALALYFQIRDDYMNLASAAYHRNKDFCEDITEGKFSFPVVHSLHNNGGDRKLLLILKQRTEDEDLKRCAIECMKATRSFRYTLAELRRIKAVILDEIAKLGGNVRLEKVVQLLEAGLAEASAENKDAAPLPVAVDPPK